MDHDIETKQAVRLRTLTGKKLRTCYFCLRYNHGHFGRALEMCSINPDDQEGGRRS